MNGVLFRSELGVVGTPRSLHVSVITGWGTLTIRTSPRNDVLIKAGKSLHAL